MSSKTLLQSSKVKPTFIFKNTPIIKTSSLPNTPITKASSPHIRKMSSLLPRVAFGPSRYAPMRNEFAPLLNLFDDTFTELSRVAQNQPGRTFTPRFDVKETKEAYTLEGELPGIDQKDVSIEFTDEHTLTVKGHTENYYESGPESGTGRIEEDHSASEEGGAKAKHPTVEDEGAGAGHSTSTEVATSAKSGDVSKPAPPKHQYWVSERSIGEFQRTFRFDHRVDQDGVKASLKNGILGIHVPKAKSPASRRINID